MIEMLDFIGACLALSIPFMLGIVVGVEIAKRRPAPKRERSEFDRFLGRFIRHAKDNRPFVGPYVRMSTSMSFEIDGDRFTIALACEGADA